MKENNKDMKMLVQEVYALLRNIENTLSENDYYHRHENTEAIKWERKEERIKEYIGECRSMIINSIIADESADMTISILDVFSMLNGIEGLLGDDYSGIL